MISLEQTNRSLARLRTLKFFPADPTVAAEVGRMINEICHTDEEAQRVVDATLDKYSEWPGPSALKEVHASLTALSQRADARCPNCAPHSAGWREAFIYVDRRSRREVSREFPDTNTFGMDKRRELEAAVRSSQNHDGYFAMARCTCPAGRRGAEYDEANRHRYFDHSIITG